MKRAFTLIELLIVMSIVVLLSTISILAVVGAKNQRTVNVVGDEIKNCIYQARSDAIAPKQTGVTSVKLSIASGKLTATEEGLSSSPNNDICSVTIPSGITAKPSDYSLTFITNDPNKIGQINGTPNDLKLSQNAKTIILTVNPVSGSVTFK